MRSSDRAQGHQIECCSYCVVRTRAQLTSWWQWNVRRSGTVWRLQGLQQHGCSPCVVALVGGSPEDSHTCCAGGSYSLCGTAVGCEIMSI